MNIDKAFFVSWNLLLLSTYDNVLQKEGLT